MKIKHHTNTHTENQLKSDENSVFSRFISSFTHTHKHRRNFIFICFHFVSFHLFYFLSFLSFLFFLLNSKNTNQRSQIYKIEQLNAIKMPIWLIGKYFKYFFLFSFQYTIWFLFVSERLCRCIIVISLVEVYLFKFNKKQIKQKKIAIVSASESETTIGQISMKRTHRILGLFSMLRIFFRYPV